jgi:hypothetical protein
MKTTIQKEINADNNLIAYCGLYCGACRSYMTGRCPGCKDNIKATWCKIRRCCMENNFLSCSDCKTIELKECNKYNTYISKVFGFIFNSNRSACINRIKEIGYDNFAIEMANNKRQTIKRI